MPESAARSVEERRRLRAFALANHPDRGGDPERFIAGLVALRQASAAPGAADDGRPVVYRRRRGLVGWLGVGRPRHPPRSLE